jgi:hypothetical protein
MINATGTVRVVNSKCKYTYFIFSLTHVIEICAFVRLSLPTKEP